MLLEGAYCFVQGSKMLCFYFFVVGAKLFLIELGQIKEVASLKLIMPCFVHMSLIKQEGLFALQKAFVLMVFNLPEEGGEDFGIVFGPADWDQPSAKEVIPI